MKEEISLAGGSTFLVYGGIKGLVKEGEDLKDSLLAFRPDLILVTVPNDSISSLEAYMADPYEITLSDYEVMYGSGLSVYGEVMIPPPTYMEAVKYARHFNVEIFGVDMNEEDYSRIYSDNVHAMDLVRHSVRKGFMMRHSFKSTTPEEFVEEWTHLVNRIKGLSNVDKERLIYIEESVKTKIKENWGKRIALVIDYEFLKDFMEFAKEQLSPMSPHSL